MKPNRNFHSLILGMVDINRWGTSEGNSKIPQETWTWKKIHSIRYSFRKWKGISWSCYSKGDISLAVRKAKVGVKYKKPLEINSQEPFINRKSYDPEKIMRWILIPKNDDEKNENEELDRKIQISHVVELKHGNGKNVKNLDIDRSGNGLVSGCFDGTIKIWNFSGLTRKSEAFQTVMQGMVNLFKQLVELLLEDFS